MPITISYCLIASIYFFCVSERGKTNLFLGDTGMIFKKNSLSEAEGSSKAVSSIAFITYFISSGFMI
jgi:hypothetical protein